jgi:hypothetical protein
MLVGKIADVLTSDELHTYADSNAITICCQ